MFNLSKKALVGLFASAVMLSACVWPEQEDPFERLPEEKLETLRGEIFPFSVSISTKATHRLEREEKLQGYLASNVIRLEDFEGRDVEVDGFWRESKMRQIFWVEGIRLKDAIVKPEESEPTESVFEAKRFLFIYPVGWDYTTAPNGTAYFLDKSDPSRRVFLNFLVDDLSEEDRKIDPNILIANMAGTKTITKDNLGRDREKIVLLSNVYQKKYSFIFTSNFEDFEKKKAFFKLLNSFIEGDDVVQSYKAKQQAELVQKEKEKIEAEEKAAAEIIAQKALERAAEEAVEKAKDEKENNSFISKIFDGSDKEDEDVIEVPEESLIVVDPVQSKVVIESGDYKSLIDARAFNYSSTHYDLAFKVPYGYWYQNFGPAEGVFTAIGFSDEAFNGRSDIKFWLTVVSGSQAKSEETKTGETLTIKYPKTDKTHFEFVGHQAFRDVMWSVLNSIN